MVTDTQGKAFRSEILVRNDGKKDIFNKERGGTENLS